jgi:hypothetical protein
MKQNYSFFIGALALMLSLTWVSATFAGQPVIQTQYGPDGMVVDLVRAKVSGKVLSVVFAFHTDGDNRPDITYDIANVYYIDNTESKKYHVLKDEKGIWLSGPFGKDLGKKDTYNTYVSLRKGDNKIVWYKFPTPPESVSHIQILLPGISPFDDVEISR